MSSIPSTPSSGSPSGSSLPIAHQEHIQTRLINAFSEQPGVAVRHTVHTLRSLVELPLPEKSERVRVAIGLLPHGSEASVSSTLEVIFEATCHAATRAMQAGVRKVISEGQTRGPVEKIQEHRDVTNDSQQPSNNEKKVNKLFRKKTGE